MPPVATPSLLARLTRRAPRTARRLEPADLGTDLGLEHWLGERELGMPPVAVAAPRRGWLPRWLQAGPSR